MFLEQIGADARVREAFGRHAAAGTELGRVCFSAHEQFRVLKLPVKLVWGAEDRLIPASYAKRWAQRLPSATDLVIVPGAGHALDFDAPEAAAKL